MDIFLFHLQPVFCGIKMVKIIINQILCVQSLVRFVRIRNLPDECWQNPENLWHQTLSSNCHAFVMKTEDISNKDLHRGHWCTVSGWRHQGQRGHSRTSGGPGSRGRSCPSCHRWCRGSSPHWRGQREMEAQSWHLTWSWIMITLSSLSGTQWINK